MEFYGLLFDCSLHDFNDHNENKRAILYLKQLTYTVSPNLILQQGS